MLSARRLVSATLRHTGAAFEDDLETDRLPSATTFDLVATAPLGEAQIRAIADIQLDRLRGRLAERDLRLVVGETAMAQLAAIGFDPLFGARPLKRAIQQRIENPVSKLILQGKFGPKDVIPVSVGVDGVFEFDRTVH